MADWLIKWKLIKSFIELYPSIKEYLLIQGYVADL